MSVSFRKKIFRRLALFVALPLALLLAVAAFVITRPGIQKDLVLAQLREHDPKAELGAVNISLLGDIHFENLVLNLPDARVACKSATAQIALFPLLRNHASFGRITLEQPELDFSRKTPAPEKPPKPHSDSATTPWRVSIEKLLVNSDAPFQLTLENDERFSLSADGNALHSHGVSSANGYAGFIDIGFSPSQEIPAAGTSTPPRHFLSHFRHQISLRFPVTPVRIPSTLEALRAAKTEVTWKILPSQNGISSEVLVNLAENRATAKARLRRETATVSAAPDSATFEAEINFAAAIPTVSAQIQFDNFSTEQLNFLDFLHSNEHHSRKIPKVSALTGTLRLAPDANAKQHKATFTLSGLFDHLESLTPSLSGLTPTQGKFHGDLLFALTPAHLPAPDWQLHLPALSLKTEAGTPLFDGSATLAAAANAPTRFEANLTTYTDGLAEQPAWRAPLAKFAKQGWCANFVAKGQFQKDITLESAKLSAMLGLGTPPLFNAELLRPLTRATLDAPPVGVALPLVRISAKDFPLALATPFLGGAQISGNATGAINLVLDTRPRPPAATPARVAAVPSYRLQFETDPQNKLALHRLSYTDASGKPRLKELFLLTNASFLTTRTSAENPIADWTLDIRDARLDAGDGRPLSGNLTLVWDADGLNSLRTRLVGDPARLLRQPLLGGLFNFESAKLNLAANYARTGPLDVRFTLDDVVGSASHGTLKKIAASATGTLAPGAPAFIMPVRVEGDTHTSDLKLTVVPNPDPAAKGTWKATLSGTQINTPDIQRLVKIFTHPKTPREEEEEKLAEKVPDAVPFWQFLGEGTAALVVEKIILTRATPPKTETALVVEGRTSLGGPRPSLFGETAAIADAPEKSAKPERPPLPALALGTTRATATITATRDGSILSIDNLVTSLGKGTLNGNAHLDFHSHPRPPVQPAPNLTAPPPPPAAYTLNGKLNLARLPFRDCLPHLAPESGEILEGNFDITATLAGTAPNRKTIAKFVEIRATSTARKGRLRVLKMDNSTVKNFGNLVETVGGAADLVNSFAGGHRSKKLAAPLQAFRQLQQYLDDFPFDQAYLSIHRTRDGTVLINPLRITNDQVLISGKGSIEAGENISLADRPFGATARFSVRGPMADTLRLLHLAKGEPDTNGFVPGPDFELSGTLNSMKNDLFPTILKAAQDALAPSGMRLFPEGAIESGAGLLNGFGL